MPHKRKAAELSKGVCKHGCAAADDALCAGAGYGPEDLAKLWFIQEAMNSDDQFEDTVELHSD